MPPRPGSRHSFTLGVLDRKGRQYLTEARPYRYADHPDTRAHVVVQGDTLETLAGKYFAPMPRACGYWWAVGWFQPDPIFDPTIELEAGRTMFIISRRVLTDVVLGETRRRAHG